MKLDLEIEKAVEKVNKMKPKKVLLQLPDGLKSKADKIIEKLPTGINYTIWAGSCYGACDTPEIKGYDLLLQFGHSKWVE